MEAKHEEADVLDEHGDQPKEQPRWHCYQGVAPFWQDLLLCTDEIDNDGAEYEAVEEHDGLEASVAEEGADDAKDEIEGAYCGSVRVVGPNDFEVVLQFLTI